MNWTLILALYAAVVSTLMLVVTVVVGVLGRRITQEAMEHQAHVNSATRPDVQAEWVDEAFTAVEDAFAPAKARYEEAQPEQECLDRSEYLRERDVAGRFVLGRAEDGRPYLGGSR